MSFDASNYQYLPREPEQIEPSRKDVVVSLLLPTDACPTTYTEASRRDHATFLTGTDVYTSQVRAPSNAPPGTVFPADTVNDEYDRVFANTIDQIGPRDLSKFLDGYDKWTIRDSYCRVRETYRKTRPTLMTPIDPIDWDLQHGTAYSKAFDDTVEIFREHLSGIALQSQTVSAPDLMRTYNAPPALRPPGYRLHEILPVVLPDDTTIFDDETPTSKACESNVRVPKVDFDEFLNPGWAQSRVPWIDDTATAQ